VTRHSMAGMMSFRRTLHSRSELVEEQPENGLALGARLYSSWAIGYAARARLSLRAAWALSRSFQNSARRRLR